MLDIHNNILRGSSLRRVPLSRHLRVEAVFLISVGISLESLLGEVRLALGGRGG